MTDYHELKRAEKAEAELAETKAVWLDAETRAQRAENAMDELEEAWTVARAERDKAEGLLSQKGYAPCISPDCACGSRHRYTPDMVDNLQAELAAARSELGYAYLCVSSGFNHGVFDFSVLRDRALAYAAARAEGGE